MNLNTFVQNRSHLFWYIGNLNEISEDFVLEQVLNFGISKM
jgi:hypothetical protein